MKSLFLSVAIAVTIAAPAWADEIGIKDLLSKYQLLENGKLGDQFDLRKSIGGPGDLAPVTYATPTNRYNSFLLNGAALQDVSINPETGLVKYTLKTSYSDITVPEHSVVDRKYGRMARVLEHSIKAPEGEVVERFMYIQDPEKRMWSKEQLAAQNRSYNVEEKMGKPNWSKVDVSKMPGLWYEGETQGAKNFVLDLGKRMKAWKSSGAAVAKGLKKVKGRMGKAGIVGAAATAATIGYQAASGEGAQADELKASDLKDKAEEPAANERSDVGIGTLDD